MWRVRGRLCGVFRDDFVACLTALLTASDCFVDYFADCHCCDMFSQFRLRKEGGVTFIAGCAGCLALISVILRYIHMETSK